MKRGWVLLLALACFGCSEIDHVGGSNIANQLQYVRDPRTGLCFAFYGVMSNGAMMASVPCDAVKAYLR